MRIATASVAIGIVASLALFPRHSPSAEADDAFDSPRMAALAKDLASAGASSSAAIVDKFFHDVQDNAPLVEPEPDDPHSCWITFLWHGNPLTRNVAVLGGPPTADIGAKLTRLGDTELWYRTDKVPSDARFTYHFLVDVPDPMPKDPAKHDKYFKEHPMVGDPLSAHPIESRDGSIVELPDAPPQPWLRACRVCRIVFSKSSSNRSPAARFAKRILRARSSTKREPTPSTRRPDTMPSPNPVGS